MLTGLIDSGYLIDIIGKNRSKDKTIHPDYLQYRLDKRTAYFEIRKKRMKRKINILKFFFNSFYKNPKAVINALDIRKYGIIKSADNLFYLYPFIRKEYDLLHCQFGPNGCLAVEMKRFGLKSVKILTTFHGYDAHFNHQTLEEQRIYYKDLFKFGDHFTANTPYLMEQLLNLGCSEKKITLLPMGIDTDYFSPPKTKKKNKMIQLISIGRLIKFKGHHHGIYSVKKMVDAGFPVEYTIMGKGEEQKPLEGLIKDLNLNKYVNLIGPRSQKEVKKALQMSDIYLMTSTHDKNGRRETQGVVTAEAQACGLPVVGFRAGGVPYTILEGKTGLLARENDIDGYIYLLKSLIENSALRKKMGLNAIEYVQRQFSKKTMISQLINLYANILQR